MCVKLFCQPSNSLRAAELLEASGEAVAGSYSIGIAFAGVESAKLGSEDSTELTDADFNLVIKRLSKKDATTKLKVTHDHVLACGGM